VSWALQDLRKTYFLWLRDACGDDSLGHDCELFNATSTWSAASSSPALPTLLLIPRLLRRLIVLLRLIMLGCLLILLMWLLLLLALPLQPGHLASQPKNLLLQGLEGCLYLREVTEQTPIRPRHTLQHILASGDGDRPMNGRGCWAVDRGKVCAGRYFSTSWPVRLSQQFAIEDFKPFLVGKKGPDKVGHLMTVRHSPPFVIALSYHPVVACNSLWGVCRETQEDAGQETMIFLAAEH
jgi:hypothetical protein